MIRLTDTEVTQFSQMREQARAGQGTYWQIYEALANLLQNTYGVASTDNTVLWLRGATEANAGRGSFSELIRTYTETQYQLRYETSIPVGKMQAASNEVANNLLDDLTGVNSQQGWPKGQVPDITRIGEADARAVGRVIFGPENSKPETDTAFTQNSAWSGALLFSLLNSNQTGRLLSTGSGGALDTLNDIRDVFYAAVAYKAGFQAAAISFAGSGQVQRLIDSSIFGPTAGSYLLGTGSFSSLLDTLWTGATGPVGQLFQAIDDIGSPKFLDMLIGATTGQSLLGTTTDANFATRAKAFFDGYGSTLQTTGAKLLPTEQSMAQD